MAGKASCVLNVPGLWFRENLGFRENWAFRERARLKRVYEYGVKWERRISAGD